MDSQVISREFKTNFAEFDMSDEYDDMEEGQVCVQGNPHNGQMVLARSPGDSVMVDALARGNPRSARTPQRSPSLAVVYSGRGPAVLFPVPDSPLSPGGASGRGRDRTPRGRDPSRHISSSRQVVQMDPDLVVANEIISELEAELNRTRSEISSWDDRRGRSVREYEQFQVQEFEHLARTWMSESALYQERH